MSTLYDARGNEFSGELDAISNITLTDPRTIGFTLGAANAEVLMDLNGKAVATFDVRATAGALTLVFEGTVDGTNYVQLPAIAVVASTGALAVPAESIQMSLIIATTHVCVYQVGVSGFRRVRARVSAYTSGNVVVAARASSADFAIYARPIPSLLHVTSVGTSGVATTTTLPAGAAGQFHYITKVQLQRICTVAVAAGAAPLIATTTNLPGSPAWQVQNNIDAVGNVSMLVDATWSNPIKSSVAATATTFVGPTPQTGNFHRWNVSYFLGA